MTRWLMIIVLCVMIPSTAAAGMMVWAYSGAYMWYSGRGMNLNNTFSQEFPIPAGGATLTFNTWYDIQPHWDYGYVEVSTDGGATWATVSGNITTMGNPNGNNPEGNGITGNSGGWSSASFDLTGYAGQTVILEFRYETDGTVNHAGWAIDDLLISEIGFVDDVEAGEGGWSSHRWNVVDGFMKARTKVKKLGPGPAQRPGKVDR